MQIPRSILKQLTLFLTCLPFVTSVPAEALNVGQPAPQFQLKAQDGNEISLASRQGKGWTVLDFHQKHKLSFTLLSDPDAKVTEAYGVKMPILKIAKRWTFIVDPTLVIRQIDDDVDPALDAQRVAEKLKQLQADP